jgi:hypothetical protein
MEEILDMYSSFRKLQMENELQGALKTSVFT